MKKIATLLFSTALFSVCSLMAQPSYSAPPGGNYPPSHPQFSHQLGRDTNLPPSATNQINWLRSYSEAVSLSQSSNKPIAILFTGTGWCPACMKLERTVIAHPEFIQAVAQRFVFLKAEFPDYSEQAVMASPYKPLLDRYKINEFPTIVVVNANGQMLFTVRYREGGPRVYAQELLQRLSQGGSRPGANPQNPNMNPNQPQYMNAPQQF